VLDMTKNIDVYVCTKNIDVYVCKPEMRSQSLFGGIAVI
jgi:hypothetical protein